MTSKSARRCEPQFPTAGVLLDNSALVRLWKCDALELLAGTVQLRVARQVATEFQKQGPAARGALARLGVTYDSVRLGTRAWDIFCETRGGRHSTRDLGEDESIAVALAAAEQSELLPFVTYDRVATTRSNASGVVTLDFLDTLAWLVGCGVATAERANDIEALASVVDGWKRPVGYTGSVEQVRALRQNGVTGRVDVWRVMIR